MGIDGDASGPPRRQFGEEGGRLSYGGYLCLPELLAQQQPQSQAPDELLFITIHQVYELWFKLLLHELESAREAMFEGELWKARHLFKRVHAVERVLIEQVEVLETMTPQDFMEFRAKLAPASGFQSVQFRELEFLSGLRDERYLGSFRHVSEEELARLRRRLAEPTLWDAYLTALSRRGLPVSDDEIMASLLAVARNRGSYDDLWQLAEDLLTHDETAALWRMRHVQMVERQIGTKSGTGGSTGAPYLRGRTRLHYFPLLWELRAWL
ncbi:tryptophan 2,3-dioxygenase [Nonomuraea gerenzanensis]|uniref:Tryptophan 2,3-dioxygenase n=1 Tax=Nonomuraea gerenzanensis TaxID=93944 RepID=A0A1M4E0Z7_9ACTN|nr:tryptophan 2,3-dioxygenase family protein [Nonomuraea gerenzanensis]UBU14767.1 tryptophan 2,3-dioxygenase [Nonomuraea gerenzanensis]SBO92494.1 Tryptophan 2,3-dioxygenase [Nonomuraea gerenzanensis]